MKEKDEKVPEGGFSDSRLAFARILFVVLFAVVLLTLIRLQGFQRNEYRSGNPASRYAELVTPSPRGTIYDRHGRILAKSIPAYSLYIDSWQVNDRQRRDGSYRHSLVSRLSEITGIDAASISRMMERPYPMIARDVGLDAYTALTEENLPGTVLQKYYKRVYPNGRLASHVIGFTGVDGSGLEGLEFFYNDLLQGVDGASLVLKDGAGSLIRSVERVSVEAKAGEPLYLTIDSVIQFIVEEELRGAVERFNAKSASAVVMNYVTGEILAMANIPDYDLNAASESTLYQRRNRLLTDLFEPGSTFKIVATSAVLEEGLFGASDEIYCEKGTWLVRNRYLRDVRPHEYLTVSEVLAKSSNIGMVKMALELGEEKLYEYAKNFGFGERTGVDLPGEISGLLRPLTRWSGHSIIAIPIGQEVGINALQSIRSMSAIANGGLLVNPHIVKKIEDLPSGEGLPGNREERRAVSLDTASVVRGMLADVSHSGGTAPLAAVKGYNVFGKTGTAQKIEDGRYSASRFLASFSGFTDAGDSEIAVFVMVDEPGPLYYGSLVAAPVFSDIMRRILHYMAVPPLEEKRDLPHIAKR